MVSSFFAFHTLPYEELFYYSLFIKCSLFIHNAVNNPLQTELINDLRILNFQVKIEVLRVYWNSDP